jgi:hypothetical protein
MKKVIILALFGIVLIACAPKPIASEKKEMFEILKQEEFGGAEFKFFEIITESKEFKMILNDPDLKKKVKADDIFTCNFLLLNMGSQNSGGYSISVESVEELENDVIVTIKENAPTGMATTVMTNPMTIVKINSKKNIIIK